MVELKGVDLFEIKFVLVVDDFIEEENFLEVKFVNVLMKLWSLDDIIEFVVNDFLNMFEFEEFFYVYILDGEFIFFCEFLFCEFEKEVFVFGNCFLEYVFDIDEELNDFLFFLSFVGEGKF